ncbi:acyl-CoA synthetase [Tropicimonas sp. S265A]|uniref:acyl-CoA synthetase n=1 Tax=Tropicimonas sp. S265A TaxID=3415134 RepID=UPI003C7B1088
MSISIGTLQDKSDIEQSHPWAEVQPAVTLYEYLTKAKSQYGARKAVTFTLTSDPRDAGETLTWEDLHGKATQAANLFRSLGVGENDVVAYMLPNASETVWALLGGATAGIVNPINPLLEPEQIASILNETGAKVLVTLKSFLKTDVAQKAAEAVAMAPGVTHVLEVDLLRYLSPPKSWIAGLLRPKNPVSHKATVLDFNAEVAKQRSDGLDFPDSFEDRVAGYFHTGGTTGMPKVAQHKYSGMIYNGWLGAELIFSPEDTLICPLPLFHVFACYPVLMSVIGAGSHVVFPTPQGYRGDGVFDNFWKLIERWNVTFMITVPTALAALMQRPVDADVSSLRIAISGSAPLPLELYNRFKEATGVSIAEGYGLTEATCLVSCNPMDGKQKVGSVGIPLPHTEVRILHCDETGKIDRECGLDEVGEICIANPGVFAGSTYTESDKNLDLFADDIYLRTGDLGRIDDEGYLWITGRAKDLIIRSGHNIDPAIIEEAMMGHPAVAMVGAIGQPDSYAGELPAVFVELVAGKSTTPEALMEFAKDSIHEKAAIPKHVEILDELPKTAVGKVFKPDLRKSAITRTYNEALDKAGVAAVVAEVTEDKKRGLVARLVKTGDATDEAVSGVLGSFTRPWEWRG